MNEKDQWLHWIEEIQSIAQAGLTYGKDRFDIERYQRLRDIAASMMTQRANLPLEQVKNLFCAESGYQTPKVDVRAAVFSMERILLVRERDGTWSLPGGWADIHLSAGENVIKEALEEAGVEVEPQRLIALQDRARHNQPPIAWSIYKVFVLCRLIGGRFKQNIETSESGWFSLDALPELSLERNSMAQIAMCFEASRADHWETVFD